MSEPWLQLQRLWSLLTPGGVLAIMTSLVPTDVAAEFGPWHYHRDPTHVVFFHARTMRYVGQRLGAAAVHMPARNVTVLVKP